MKKLHRKLIMLPVGKRLHFPGQNGIPIRVSRIRMNDQLGWSLVHAKNQFFTTNVNKIIGYLLSARHRVIERKPSLRREQIQITDLGNF